MFNLKNLFSSTKRVWPWIKAHKIWSAVIAVVFIIIVFSISSGGDASLAAKTSEVKTGTVAQEVSVTGRVKGAEAVDLSFERSSRVTWIPAIVGAKVRQGQTLVQLDAGETVAQRQQAQAGVMSAQARYDQLLAGARQEDVDVLRSSMNTAIAQASNTARTAVAVGVNSLVILTDIQNAHIYFYNGSSETVQLALAKEQALYALYSEQNLGRVQPWYFTPLTSGLKGRIDRLTITDGMETVSSSLDDLGSVLDKILSALRVAQSTLYGYPDVPETEKTRLQGAIDSMLAQQQALTGAEGGMRDAKARLDLKIASPESYDVIASKSQLDQAKASLALVDAQLAKYTLRAPFAGTITSVDVTRGEVVSPSAPVVSLIGDGNFEIEANISEADIASVKVGNLANVTFDAYGQGSLFTAQVVHVDPAGSVQGGVAVYRVTLQFSKQDERILAGLTANVDLQTARKDDVVFVPSRDVITRNGKKFIKVLLPIDSSDSRFASLAAVSENKTQRIVEVEISTGLRGSDGRTEVLSGVQVGDVVVGQ